MEKIISGESYKENVTGKSWAANELCDGSQEILNGKLEVEKCSEQGQDFDTSRGGFQGSENPQQPSSRAQHREKGPWLQHSDKQPPTYLSSLPSIKSTVFDDAQGSPSSVGSSCSDEAVEKRIRNNQASRKFRRLRKERHKTLFARAYKLEQENQVLKNQVKEMMKEVVSLRSLLTKQILHV